MVLAYFISESYDFRLKCLVLKIVTSFSVELQNRSWVYMWMTKRPCITALYASHMKTHSTVSTLYNMKISLNKMSSDIVSPIESMFFMLSCKLLVGHTTIFTNNTTVPWYVWQLVRWHRLVCDDSTVQAWPVPGRTSTHYRSSSFDAVPNTFSGYCQ